MNAPGIRMNIITLLIILYKKFRPMEMKYIVFVNERISSFLRFKCF